MNIPAESMPKCIGFIMDGNRRFAREQGKEAFEGHVAGKEKLREVLSWLMESKVQHAVFYTFSTENWQRSKNEVEGLLHLFKAVIAEFHQTEDETEESKKVALRIIGRQDDFSPELQKEFLELEASTAKYAINGTAWFALSYGGRAEILSAVNQAVALGKEVTEEEFSKLLWTKGMPEPDLIIRTGGEQRLSNFLPWQSIYSELFFTATYWPAFTKEEFQRILEEYAARERRVGK